MPTALITGASKGIGAAFARSLAARKTDLVLVARSETKLAELAEQLRQQFQIQVVVIVQDLTEIAGAAHVFEVVKSKGWEIDLLINNAGFGDYSPFAQSDRPKQMQMMQLNMSALVDLTHLFLPEMQQRRSGCIINVASIAAFQALPYLSVYAATKAFVLSFSAAIAAENRTYGIKVQVLCPGPTQTEFAEVAGMKSFGSGKAPGKVVSAEEVVDDSLKALRKNKLVVVTGGFGNRITAVLTRFLPRVMLANAIEKLLRPQGLS